ncbi:EGF-like repeat and discoidin I-like domain-containing protein 3, partial [Eriocheir sinensis]|uniref:EGF-like repeat and discoidin I-like domain-containing protein 3 n=1 Tax=Eriocheir sinensis TaxID=95602 RepID=UPI0021CAC7D8
MPAKNLPPPPGPRGEPGESPPVTPEEVPAVEVLGQEEYSYNTSSVQGDSPLLPDDADDFLPPIISTEAPLENPSPPGCSSPLGLTTGDVLDWQISASSLYPATWDAGCQVKYARLHQPNGRAWCAGRRAAGEWVLVDLGVPAKVTGLLTQGKGDDEEWVTSLELSYSLDAYHWHFARDIYNNKK